jgi:hypothetical protein
MAWLLLGLLLLMLLSWLVRQAAATWQLWLDLAAVLQLVLLRGELQGRVER